jgi:hypothetical protein
MWHWKLRVPFAGLALGLLTIAACGDGDAGSGGSGGAGAQAGSDAFPQACPGFESEPGAGCPAPCEPLVEGGPGGRAYCTTPCPDCNAGFICGYSDVTVDELDVCLPGTCDAQVQSSCPDDFECVGSGYCNPSPGITGTRCEAYVPKDGEACSAQCSYRLEISGGVLCTSECEAENHPCAAGYDCVDDLEGKDAYPGLCSPPCTLDSDCPLGIRCSTTTCPFPPCIERGICDYLFSL